jgi:ketol-acid reductoisomerase
MQSKDAHHEHVTSTLGRLSIAVIGYGIQGRAQALNLRDAGIEVRLGLRRGSPSWGAARDDGWAPRTIERATEGADLIAVLVPDAEQAELFATRIAPRLERGATLVLAHGFSLRYGQLALPPGVDAAVVAPKLTGDEVRRRYLERRSIPCLLAVHQDATGHARDRALGYALALGGTRASVIDATVEQETETELFAEQAVLLGGLTELVTAGFETLVTAGYPAELAYLECFHQLKLVADALHEGGLARVHRSLSDTARYGEATRGPRVINAETRERMREVLGEIRSGRFAAEWLDEARGDRARFEQLRERAMLHPSEITGRRLRWKMNVIQERRVPPAIGAKSPPSCRGCWRG